MSEAGRAAGASASPAPADASGARTAHAALLASLALLLEQVIAPYLPAECRVALLDFPQASNVGDSMIWLGTILFLAQRRAHVCYTCSNASYSRAALSKALGDGLILLHGGGNFGDLYPTHQDFRETVVRDFPRHRIVQLPQTIHFQSTEALARARSVVNGHPGVVLLARDQASLDIAAREFQVPAQLCPDMAFALGPMVRPVAPTHDVVWLQRVDKEAAGARDGPVPAGVLRADWLGDRRSPAHWMNRRLTQAGSSRPKIRPALQGPLSLTYDPLARERLRRGAELLSSGRAVVANRLHAHILSLLLGIPHVLLDNSYGKVRACYDTWTRTSPLVEWGTDETQALRRAAQMAAAGV